MVFPVLALCLALSGGSTDGSDVTVQLDTAEFSLLFRLPFGSHTRMFLQEVTKACVVNERNGLGDSPENIVIQKCSLFKPVAQSALLVPSTGLDPATRDPEFQWLSRYRCAPPQEAGSPTLRDWNSAPGTWPACGTIGGGRYPSHKKRWGLEQVLPQGAGSVLFRGGAKAQTNFRLAEVARGGVAEWGRHARGGRRYEELEEAGREMSAAAGSRERDSAGGSNFNNSRLNEKGLLVDQSSGGQDKPESLLPRQNKSKSEITDMVRSSTITVSNKAHMLSMQKFGLRDTIVKSHLIQKEEDYTYVQNFRFFVGTYNVNGQSPKECLRPWLSHGIQAPDVYCVGFQELDLSKEAFFFHDTPKEEEWFKAVSEGLHPDAKYAKVKLIRLVGIMLLLYVKQEHAAYISEVEAETVGTGIMGRMGNKGGVAIRFQLHNTSICVVNSHLAAHTEEYERRNQDYKDICSRMQFCQVDPSLPPLTINKHDVILWLGDLNYRIEELDVEKVKKLIEEKAFQTLYAYDQLKIQVAAKTVFEGFTEGELTFQPTYKYDTGSDDWDTSEKCRAPAWCDRVLWKGKNINQLSYQSHMALKTSDHKPVSSVFDIGVRVINEELYRKTLEEIVRSLDKMENANIPSVCLSKREFCFQNVKYMQLQVESFTIHNGQVPCQFEFINKPGENSFCKQWLSANPSKGFLLPDSDIEIELELFVNKTTATKLNSGEDKIEDILVLHLEGGKDYFLSVSGNYLPSCFGSPIHTLCYMREPILDLPLETVSELTLMPVQTEDDGSRLEKPMEIPKELWMMVDYLYRNAIQQEDLFQQPGLRSEFEHIRDCLDTGMIDNLSASNHSVAEALLLFLESLPEPVICYSAYHNCLECSGNYTASKQVISTLPTFHKNVFNYLMAFLQELLKNSAKNHLDENILASVFGSLLLRNPAQHQKPEITEKKKAQEFIHQFLCNPL
ncbi:Hypothetical predicted protein [Marmota monax]|uniref:phosphoinositide 5-phosphatase n=1 Tax=Marmota monax TaxID=9995 RepID=A0A5E4A6Q2_MARMO|nr:Hypothetical predicted protein [Marmota monax]